MCPRTLPRDARTLARPPGGMMLTVMLAVASCRCFSRRGE
jgi:hypothetical protein